MYKTNKIAKSILTALAALFVVLSINTFDANAQEGPQNYCVPNPAMVPGNAGIGYPESFWCYPLYYLQYNYRYFTVPILQVQIYDASNGEIKLNRESRNNINIGTYTGPWEGCYKYTGVKGELEPGATYRIRMWVNYDYYQYMTSQYCYATYYTTRVFLDWNLDGDFHDANEWLNSPASISAQKTKKIGSTLDWWAYRSGCIYNSLQEWEFTVPEENATGIGRLRVAASYNYPYSAPVNNYSLGMGYNACWNGYAYDYTAYYGGYYGYNFGEMEDYLIEFVIPIKEIFPTDKAPDDILLAAEAYDGTTRNGNVFKRPMVRFGGPQAAGALLTYKIVGPLPSTTTVYEARYNGATEIPIGDAGVLDANFAYYIQNAVGTAVSGNFAFKTANGGEYQVVVGFKKPGAVDYKIVKKNFTVSWEWDIAARTISMPLGNKEPRYYKYPRNLSMDLRGEVQNTGLRGIAKFDAYYRIYNSKGELIEERVKNWDTANFGEYVVNAKSIVQLDFGTFKTSIPDEYKGILIVKLRSATDLEPYNDEYRRVGEEPFTFEVRDEIQAQAYNVIHPKNGIDIIAGRPFIPAVEIRNQGVGDITNCPTTITVTDEANKVIFTQTILVQDIPSGRYNLKTVYFDPKIISKPGTYTLTFKVKHPDDMVPGDDEISVTFTVSGGLSGTYTIGTKNSGNSRNFSTIEEATDAIFLRGLNSSVTFEFTDAEYNVDSKNNYSPAWDLSTAIMGLGYNAETGTYNTLTFKPSIDRSVTKGSIKINLNSTNGIGVFLGQSIGSTNSNSVQADNFGRSTFVKYSNNGGYITFDGGANNSFKFVINSNRPAFAAAFYLNGGASNMTIKNVIVENGSPATACSVNLPNVVFSVVDGFTFTENEYITETGYQGYSAGIVNRANISALSNQDVVVALDTLPNKNNKIINNEVSGFGYGIVSYGIGPLRVPELQDYRPFYNQNTEIANNKIYNITGAGIVVGHEHGSVVNNNAIFDVNGNCGDFAAGILAGGNSRLGVQGYNNMDLKINGNKISNVRGNGAVYGVLVDQNLNKYPVGNKFANFPDRNDNLAVTNNAIFDIKAKTSNTMRVGIHALTERDKEVSDGLSRLVSPRYTDVAIKDLLISNNTVLLSEDGINNNNQFVGIGIQQAHNAKLMNNAVSITDGTISSNNEAAAGVFYQGSYSYENGGLIADRNAYWLQNANVSAYRHIYVDQKNKIVELGNRNEYLTLEQWQMASMSELNSVVSGDFSNDYYTMGTYPAELHVKSSVKGSVLSKRGDRMTEYEKDVYGIIRGQAGSRYDIGAVEFNGSLYNRDAEMLVITEPGSYRATTGLFSDAEYLMTDAPIPVKAVVRNSGSLQVNDKKFTVNIYRQNFIGTWVPELGPIDVTADIEATEHSVIDFKLADGVGSEFTPKTYNDLRSEYSSVPAQFLGMEPNVTPLYKIVITVDSDEFNGNNKVEKVVRFYLRRSEVKVLVSNQNYVDVKTATVSNDLASGLNKNAIDKGMNLIGWKIDLVNGRYDYDVFHRAGWEPRNVNYNNYRSLFWSDGDENTLSRLQKLNLSNFVNAGSVAEKKNLIIMSQEMVRNNTNVDDADEVFVRDILRAEYRFPGNPLGNGQNYDGKTITGVNLARDKQFSILSTGVLGDSYPMPGLMNIVETGDGISKMAIRYDYAQNNEWPDAARIGGVGTSTLSSNVLYVAIDWRHFGDVESLLRGTFDFAEGNGGIVVPVELMNFDATAIGKRVELNWRTASEQGSSRFEVERADVNANGVSSFVKIDEVAAAGNSSIISNYGPIVDNNVNYGSTYSYRLKMVDADGKFDYSDVKTVTLGGLDGKAWLGTVNPNPVNANSVLEYGLGEGMNIEINIYDANGKVVRNITNGYQNAGTHKINLNASDLSSGTYTIVMNVGETVLTQSITVVK